MSQFPAIIITVYHRLEHLKQCLESIENSKGTENYHVFVGSDAAAIASHSDAINQVREYLRGKERNNAFCELTVISHLNNVGSANNAKLCYAEAKKQGHKTFIRLEDDVVVGKYFLEFMYDGLTKFQDDKKVIAINGFIHPNLKHQQNKPFLFDEFAPYGFASWFDKWDELRTKRDKNNYPLQVINHFKLFKKQSKATVHARTYPFLAEGFYRATDIELNLQMQLKELLVLAPPQAITANRGLDGSGLRSGVDNELQNMPVSDENYEIPMPDKINTVKYLEIADRVSLKNQAMSWFAFITYRFIPFGFSILKQARKIKRKGL